VTIESVELDEDNEVANVTYSVTGPEPEYVVHKAGTQFYQQSGASSGEVVQNQPREVEGRTANEPCPEGTTALKFEGGELTSDTTKSYPDSSEEDTGANPPNGQGPPGENEDSLILPELRLDELFDFL
jgi:hypothetical protein